MLSRPAGHPAGHGLCLHGVVEPVRTVTPRLMRFFPLEKLINLHDGYSRRFKIDSRQVLRVQERGELYLFEAHCPHRSHPLDGAGVEHGVVECALHHYRFSLDDGRLLHATEETCRGLRTFPVIYEGNEVGLLLDSG